MISVGRENSSVLPFFLQYQHVILHAVAVEVRAVLAQGIIASGDKKLQFGGQVDLVAVCA